MSALGKTVLKKVGDVEVICRELTVADVRKLLQPRNTSSILDAMLFEQVELGDLPTFTSLTLDAIESMHPSDLKIVVQGCVEANPDFFAFLARVAKVSNKA